MSSSDSLIREWDRQTPEQRQLIRAYAIRYLEYTNAVHGGAWWPVVRTVYNAREEVIGAVVRLRWHRKVRGNTP